MHRTTDRFWQCFGKLPIKIQDVAKDNFDLLKSNDGYERMIKEG